MKKIPLLLLFVISLIGCHREKPDVDFRQEMRKFVEEISDYAKAKNPTFIIIPQNGVQLLADNEDNMQPESGYLNAIDAVAQEELLYGYDSDDKPTPSDITNYLKKFLDIAKNAGKVVLVIDYCNTHSYIDDSYSKNNSYGFISFAAPDREMRIIPDYPTVPYNVNDNDINSIKDAKNFLYIINPENYTSADNFISDLENTDYDIILVDLFVAETQLNAELVNKLKTKSNGGKRLVICYMSIGEAEDYRFYWNTDWDKNPPDWIEGENQHWKGNYKVRYWYNDWKKIIYGNPNAYLDKILNANFDGVYLDIIDAFEYFEDKYEN